MPVCYFENNHHKKYRCNYEIKEREHIVIKTSRSIEDNFLLFYRFIECYYKKQQISNIRTTFITYSIKVHSGYFIKNSCLRVSFDRINRTRNFRDYTVNNVDIHWIYERTKMLYTIVIDIIFHNMLGYSDYMFNMHF